MAFASPQGEKPEGTGDPDPTDASHTEKEPGGPATGATIDMRGSGAPSPASSEPNPSAQQLGPDLSQKGVLSRISDPEASAASDGPGESGDEDTIRDANRTGDAGIPQHAASPGSSPAATVHSSANPDPAKAGPITTATAVVPVGVSPEVANGMEDFQRLRRRLLVSTLVASSAAVPLCWLLFDLPAALSLLVGSVAGLLYLVLLARSVARLGGERRSVSKVQLLVPVVLVLASARIPQLELVPALVGFLLYKPALLVQALLDR